MVIGRKQFVRANDAQLAALLGPDRVLAALAARQRQECDVRVKAAREIGRGGSTIRRRDAR